MSEIETIHFRFFIVAIRYRAPNPLQTRHLACSGLGALPPFSPYHRSETIHISAMSQALAKAKPRDFPQQIRRFWGENAWLALPLH
jgi:hypothetical protein